VPNCYMLLVVVILSLVKYLAFNEDESVMVNVCCLSLLEFRLALIQLAVTANKADNVHRATELIANASKQGAQLISLPVSHPQTCHLV